MSGLGLYSHWRRFGKNIGWENQSIGEKVVKSDKCMDVSQLLGGTCPGCPQSLRLIVLIGADLGGSPGTCSPIIEKRPCSFHLIKIFITPSSIYTVLPSLIQLILLQYSFH